MIRALVALAAVLAASVANAQTALVYEGGLGLTQSERQTVLNDAAGYWLGFGSFKEYAPSSRVAEELGRITNIQQTLVGRDARIMFTSRPDLMQKYEPSYAGTTTIDSVSVPYCSTYNDNCADWGGAVDGFDTDWILRVPRAAAIQRAQDRFGVNPFESASCAADWSSAVDCDAIQALATASTVPQLYADYSESGGLFVGQVVMDLRKPAYRAWRIKMELAALRALRVTPGEEVAIFLGPKTGWYAAQPDTSANYRSCRADGDKAYAGTLWGSTKPAACTSGWDSQPMFDTPYAPGEYEAAYNRYVSELIQALDKANLHGVKFIVQRAPPGYGLSMATELPSLYGHERFAGEFLGVANPVAGSLTPDFSIVELGSADGTNCPAPCAVMVDARATADSAYTREFHSGYYRWNFGDSASASDTYWDSTYSGLNRNEDAGPLSGHMYETPGTYTITLTVTMPDGESKTEQKDVTVESANTYYGDARTWCFATAAGRFDGCPLDDDSDGTCEVGESSYSNQCVVTSDFDDALTNNTASAGCNIDGASAGSMPRCLFRGGSLYVASAGVVPNTSATSMGQIGTFGPSSRVQVSVTFAGALFTLPNYVSVWGIAAGSSVADYQFAQRIGATDVTYSNFGLYDSSATGRLQTCWGLGTGGEASRVNQTWFIGNTCTKTATTVSGNQFTFYYGSDSLYIGNTLNSGFYSDQEFSLRAYSEDGVFTHNQWLNPGHSGDGRSAVQFRAACDASETTCPGSLQHPSTYNYFAFNKLALTYGPGGALDWMKVCGVQGGCQETTDTDGENDSGNFVIENNFFTASGAPVAGTELFQGLVLQGHDLTVRNNVFDAQGFGLASSGFWFYKMTHPDAATYGGDNIHINNNTLYIPFSSADSSTLVVCGGSSTSPVGSGHECQNNLVYTANHTGTRTLSDAAAGFSTASNNVVIDGSPGAMPFTSPVPGVATTVPTDFIPLAFSGTCDSDSDGDGAEDCGRSFASDTDTQLIIDWGLGCRPVDGADADTTAEWDIGAWERNAAACP